MRKIHVECCIKCGKKDKERYKKRMCLSCYNTQLVKNNPLLKKKVQDRHKAYYESNKEKVKKRASDWAKANRQRRREIMRAWAKRNPEKHNENQKKYIAMIKLRTPKWANIEQIKEFYRNCPYGYHVDHIIPLRGKNVSGLHVIENLQYLPAIENINKSNTYSEVYHF